MRITLKNFKQYGDFALDLPETGLVLLKGETGKGKSSIFEAIYDAVTGNADDVIPWTGEKPAIVTLEAAGMTITRSHTPTSLQVILAGEAEARLDAEAQAMIYEQLGMTAQEFLASCYIRQRMEGSLLSLGAADQLRFIQKLAFGDQDPEVYKKRIAAQIVGREGSIKIEETRLAERNQRVQFLESKVASLKDQKFPELTPPSTEAENDERAKRGAALIQDNQADMRQLKKIKELEQHAAHELRTQRDALVAQKQAEIEQNQQAIRELADQRASMGEPYATMSRDAARALSATLDTKARFFDWLERAKAFSSHIRSKYPECSGPAVAFLESAVASAQSETEEITEHRTHVKEAIRELEHSAAGHVCPHCAGALDVVKGKVLKSSGRSAEDVAAELAPLQAKYDELATAQDAAKARLAMLTNDLAAGSALKQTAVSDPHPEIATPEELAQRAGEIMMYQETQTKLERELATNGSMTAQHARQIQQAQQMIADLEARIQSYADIPTRAALQDERAQCDERIRARGEELDAIAKADAAYQKYRADAAAEEAHKKVVADAERELLAARADLQTAEDAANQHKARWGASMRLKAISDAAAIGSTEAVIAAINAHAKSYLDQMFPHGGTSVRILSGFKTKKGEDRAKLALEIIHKGQEVKSLRPLSGGEKDRITLAFQLAMCELYQAPFLMIDEGFAGIDVENTMGICLDALKEMASEKLIIMAQHGAPEGYFDQVIAL